MGHREILPPPSGVGTVVLDIGDEYGAAIVNTPNTLAGTEIEIRQVGQRWDGRHVAVRERQLPNGPRWAAVFTPLVQGRWQVRLRDRHRGPVATFTVTAGKVTTSYMAAEFDAFGPTTWDVDDIA